MCIDPGTLIVLTSVALTAAAAGGIAKGFEVSSANKAAEQQYQYQRKQADAANKAAMEQYNQQTSRNNIDAQRQAAAAFNQSQSQIIENMRRQAAAEASAGSAGMTGMAVQQLTSDYQSAIGGIASNLQGTMQQLNENLFFNNDNARRQTQSYINQNQPQPYMAQNAMGAGLVAGGVQGIQTFASGMSGLPAGSIKMPKFPSGGSKGLSLYGERVSYGTNLDMPYL